MADGSSIPTEAIWRRCGLTARDVYLWNVAGQVKQYEKKWLELPCGKYAMRSK